MRVGEPFGKYGRSTLGPYSFLGSGTGEGNTNAWWETQGQEFWKLVQTVVDAPDFEKHRRGSGRDVKDPRHLLL